MKRSSWLDAKPVEFDVGTVVPGVFVAPDEDAEGRVLVEIGADGNVVSVPGSGLFGVNDVVQVQLAGDGSPLGVIEGPLSEDAETVAVGGTAVRSEFAADLADEALLLAGAVLVVGPGGEVRLKDGVVTANNFTGETFQGVDIFGATFTQVDADDPTQAQLKIADGRLYALNYRDSGDPSQPDSEFELRAGGALELRMKQYGGGGTVEVTPNSIILEKDDGRLFFDSKNVTAQVGVVVEERPWLEVLAPSANTVIVDGVSHEASGTFTTSRLTMSASGNIFTASIQSYMDALPAAPTGWVRVPMVVRGAGNSTWVTNANGQWFAAGSTSAARAITVAWWLIKE